MHQLNPELSSLLAEGTNLDIRRNRITRLIQQFPAIALDERKRPYLIRTQLLVSIVIRHLSDRSWDGVIRLFPELSLQDVRDALGFSAALMDEGVK